MRGLSNQARILVALKVPRTDAEVAQETGIPEPSVRRTRLHLCAAGAVVAASVGGGVKWRARQPWEQPLQYHGQQDLPKFSP